MPLSPQVIGLTAVAVVGVTALTLGYTYYGKSNSSSSKNATTEDVNVADNTESAPEAVEDVIEQSYTKVNDATAESDTQKIVEEVEEVVDSSHLAVDSATSHVDDDLHFKECITHEEIIVESENDEVVEERNTIKPKVQSAILAPEVTHIYEHAVSTVSFTEEVAMAPVNSIEINASQDVDTSEMTKSTPVVGNSNSVQTAEVHKEAIFTTNTATVVAETSTSHEIKTIPNVESIEKLEISVLTETDENNEFHILEKSVEDHLHHHNHHSDVESHGFETPRSLSVKSIKSTDSNSQSEQVSNTSATENYLQPGFQITDDMMKSIEPSPSMDSLDAPITPKSAKFSFFRSLSSKNLNLSFSSSSSSLSKDAEETPTATPRDKNGKKLTTRLSRAMSNAARVVTMSPRRPQE